MPIEIEKKYRLTPERLEPLRERLKAIGAEGKGAAEFEENTIYTGPGLDPARRVLRLRRKGGRADYKFKERDRLPRPGQRHAWNVSSTEIVPPVGATTARTGHRL